MKVPGRTQRVKIHTASKKRTVEIWPGRDHKPNKGKTIENLPGQPLTE
jgi:hypothetical protein